MENGLAAMAGEMPLMVSEELASCLQLDTNEEVAEFLENRPPVKDLLGNYESAVRLLIYLIMLKRVPQDDSDPLKVRVVWYT